MFRTSVVALAAAGILFGQERSEPGGPALPAWNVLYGADDYSNANAMFSSYLSKLRRQEEDRRSKVIAALSTPDEIRGYQRETRERLVAALGGLPARTPLNARITGVLERDGYAVEKLIFESRPRYYVTANVYVPRRRSGPFPGVIAPVGHWGMGKSFDEYQRLGIFLARRGYVTLVYDVPGQGERREYFNPVVNRALIDPGGSHWFVTLEHGYAGAQAILTGGNYASYLVWDGIRALDYLSGRKDVDPARLACTGTSGGGLQTELLSAVDERIGISIPVCYGGCNPDNPARPGLTVADIDALIAPRPLLMIEATGDPRPGVTAKQDRHREIESLYKRAGEPSKTRFIVVDGPHGYVPAMHEAAYTWMQRWFAGKEVPLEDLAEPVTAVESASNLHATASGEVSMSLGGETVFSLNRFHASLLAASRIGNAEIKETIRAAIALDRPVATEPPRTLARIDRGAYFLEKIVYHSEPEIYVPSVFLLPKGQEKRPAVLFVNEDGKAEPRMIESFLEPLVRAGLAVLSIDPRGMGETDPEAPRSSKPADFKRLVHDAESGFFHDAIRVGKTVPGMRAHDVTAGVSYLAARPEIDASRISAIGHGAGGLIVLFAAAFDDRVRSVAVTGSLISYSAIAESDLYTHRFGSFGPGFLRGFDLPDVAALIAPRPLLIQNPVDALHRVLDVAKAREALGSTARAYEKAGSADRFRVEHDTASEGIAARYLAMIAAGQPRLSKR
jgi:dienelactone hydrolase